MPPWGTTAAPASRARAEHGGDLVDRPGPDDRGRRADEPPGPVADLARDDVGIGEHVRVADRGAQGAEQRLRFQSPPERTAVPRSAPWRSVPDSLRGQLLVATPPLVDPNFDRSVVLLLEHGEDGALGIILNRPTDASLASVLPEWHAHASAPGVVFSGGPVAPEAVIALARGGHDAASGLGVGARRGRHRRRRRRSRPTSDFALEALRVFVGLRGLGARASSRPSSTQDAWFVVTTRADRPVLRRSRAPLARRAAPPARPRRDVRQLPGRPHGELNRGRSS